MNKACHFTYNTYAILAVALRISVEMKGAFLTIYLNKLARNYFSLLWIAPLVDFSSTVSQPA